jgi:hypothetical protein
VHHRQTIRVTNKFDCASQTNASSTLPPLIGLGEYTCILTLTYTNFHNTLSSHTPAEPFTEIVPARSALGVVQQQHQQRRTELPRGGEEVPPPPPPDSTACSEARSEVDLVGSNVNDGGKESEEGGQDYSNSSLSLSLSVSLSEVSEAGAHSVSSLRAIDDEMAKLRSIDEEMTEGRLVSA